MWKSGELLHSGACSIPLEQWISCISLRHARALQLSKLYIRLYYRLTGSWGYLLKLFFKINSRAVKSFSLTLSYCRRCKLVTPFKIVHCVFAFFLLNCVCVFISPRCRFQSPTCCEPIPLLTRSLRAPAAIFRQQQQPPRRQLTWRTISTSWSQRTQSQSMSL